jgi:RimJ/RimL family protein N-acetyltransferase
MFPEITRDDIFRLETKRLWLRWPCAADADAIARYAGDPEVALKTASIPHPYERWRADEHILWMRQKNATSKALCLALAPKRLPGELIGLIDLRDCDEGEAATLGYWLGKPHWGRGLMTEAARAVVDLAFAYTDIRRICASCLPTNVGSLRILEKLGFVRTGEATLAAPQRGGEILVTTALLAREAACRAGAPFAGMEPSRS